MSFSIVINGHAGSGMDGNSQEEIDAVHTFIAATLEAAKTANLDVTLGSMNPPGWAPEVMSTAQVQAE